VAALAGRRRGTADTTSRWRAGPGPQHRPLFAAHRTRQTRHALTLNLRGSRGERHPLTLPEGAKLQSVPIDGSSRFLLRWYRDRLGTTVPQAQMWSLPVLVFRFAMLGWALWLAFAPLRWLRWGWLSAKTLWRPSQWRRKRWLQHP
jgi:hypothetical protein